MTHDWQHEIEDLHVFFERWLGGTLPKSETSFERLAVLAPSFHIIDPEGVVWAREPLMKRLFEGHGAREGLHIDIKNAALRFENAAIILATYEEWQDDGNTSTARLSTVVFEKLAENEGAGTLRWLHVHETWL